MVKLDKRYNKNKQFYWSIYNTKDSKLLANHRSLLFFLSALPYFPLPPFRFLGDDPNYRQSASSTSDTVFLPSDIANWSVDDVAEFVRSLKGCEDYSQVG